MKSFIIKSPGKGKTTCSLVHQYYDKESRRTKTKYLGSVNASADPNLLPAGIRTGPGAELSEFDLRDIRRWLVTYGTFGKWPQVPQDALDAARREIREEMEAERNREEMSYSDLDRIRNGGLHVAAAELEARVKEMRERGVELSKGLINYSGTDAAKCKTPMDELKLQVNCIRAAWGDFETMLKDCGLIRQVRKSGKAQV